MTAQTILPANSAASGGYEVANSLRFNRASSDYLSRATNVTGTNTKFTLSFWIKLCDIANFQSIFEVYKASNERVDCGFNLDNTLQPRFFIQEYTGSYIYRKIFTRLLRDVAAWTHYVIKFDSSESEANRLKVYINGVEETATDQANLPADGATSIISVGTQHIGYSQNNSGHHLNGYLAEFVLIEGTDYAPTSFGEFDEDSGIWKPIDVSGLTFGTNGFYLDFEESGTSANSSGLGADKSGNDHHFTVNNLTAVDQSTDTCTNNFATFNPLTTSLQSGGVVAYSEGNTKIVTAYSNTNYLRYPQAYTTLGVTSGKWYAEFKIGAIGSASVGIANTGELGSEGTTNPFAGAANSGAVYTNGGEYRSGIAEAGSQGTYTEDDIIGCALDLDNLAIYWHKNGTYINSGDPTSGSSKTGARAVVAPTTAGGFYVFTAGADNTGIATIEINLGSPSYSESGGETDGNGFGNFNQAVPSGYFALCTKNLAEHG